MMTGAQRIGRAAFRRHRMRLLRACRGELARALQSRGAPVPANLAALLDAEPLPVLTDLLGARPCAALEAGTRR